MATARPDESHHHLAGELRTNIESAVRAAQPDFASEDFLGQEVGAFADFLIWGLTAHPRLRRRTVAIYDSTEGSCQIYRSPHHIDRTLPVLALWYTPDHYQWLRFAPPGLRLIPLRALHRQGPANFPRVPDLVMDAAG